MGPKTDKLRLHLWNCLFLNRCKYNENLVKIDIACAEIDRVKQDFGSVNKHIGTLRYGLASANGHIGMVRSGIASVQQHMEEVRAKQASMSNDVTKLQRDVAELELDGTFPLQEFIQRGINVTWYKQDTDNDYTKALTDALQIGRNIYFPPGSYEVNFPKLPEGVLIYGEDAVVIGGLSLSSNTIIRGIKFAGKTSSGTYLNPGVWITEGTGITIENCLFDQTRIYAGDPQNGKTVSKIRIQRCSFTGDYNGFQVDPQSIEMYGGYDVHITDNLFDVVNAHRFLKISTSNPDSTPVVEELYSRRVVISGNIMKGSLKPKQKQVIDLFNGAVELVIANNVAEIDGEPDVFLECKPDGARGSSTSKHRQIAITGNSIQVRSKHIITLYGANSLPFEDGLQTCTIVGNELKSTHPSPSEAIDVRGFNQTLIANNNIFFAGDHAYLVAICAACNDAFSINGNVANKGSILIESEAQTKEGMDYRTDWEQGSVKGNILRNYRYYGGINLMKLHMTQLIIEGNVMQSSDGAKVNSAIYIDSESIVNLIMTGNMNKAMQESFNRVLLVNGDVVRCTDTGNSWNAREIEGTAPPAGGAWKVSDTVRNKAAVSGQYIGWVCVAAGRACNTLWQPNTAYNVNAMVNANGKVYKCTKAGTSGNTAPTQTSGAITDGTVTWQYLDAVAVFSAYGMIV
ncbi:carbohydrate-binding protein [Paenibacillus apiarius]|uniref:carbohydrate-binding protein n=1 Tax=Paenibacillus apiarius TaxID=46240 RepID=UPI003B3A3D4F